MNSFWKIAFFCIIACFGTGAVHAAPLPAKANVSAYSVLSLANPYKTPVSDMFNFPCGATLTDRDGFTYKTVQVGTQCWMAENLKTKTRPDGVPLTTGNDTSERDCISSSNTRGTEADCQKYGALYTLAGIYFDNDLTQDICPRGWRTPQDSDFALLEQSQSPTRSCNPDRNSREGATATGCRAILPLDDCRGSGAALKIGGSTGFDWQLSGVRLFDEASNTVSFQGSGRDGYLWSRDLFFNWCGWRHGNFEFGIYRQVSKFSPGIIREKIFVGEPLVGDVGITAMQIRCIKK